MGNRFDEIDARALATAIDALRRHCAVLRRNPCVVDLAGGYSVRQDVVAVGSGGLTGIGAADLRLDGYRIEK
jgi:hypothetical protein